MLTEKLIIIGSGPAGLTSAIYAARAQLNPLVIEGSEPGGQLMGTTTVENWPGEKSIQGPQLMARMREQAVHLGARFVQSTIATADCSSAPFTLTTKHGETFVAESIIIATGATPKRLSCPGEAEFWGRGVSTCAVCDGAFYKNRPVVIVGGGDTAMEDALFMTNFTDQITIVHILDALTGAAAMQSRVRENPAINIIYASTVTAIVGADHVTGVEITNTKTSHKQNFPTDAVFVAIGLNPNTTLFKNHLALTKTGHIALTEHTKTSQEGIFAAGDVADVHYRQAITSAGTGCMAALDAEKYLKKTIKSLE